jgi:hypothetical protein
VVLAPDGLGMLMSSSSFAHSRDAVEAAELLRIGDARLDWKLRHLCRLEIEKLCSNDAADVGGLDRKLMLDDWDAPYRAGQ